MKTKIISCLVLTMCLLAVQTAQGQRRKVTPAKRTATVKKAAEPANQIESEKPERPPVNDGEATLAETFEFLKGKLLTAGVTFGSKSKDDGWRSTSSYQYSQVRLENKVIEIQGSFSSNTYFRIDSSRYSDGHNFLEKFNLSDINLSSIKVLPCYKENEYFYDGECFKVSMKPYNENKLISSQITDRRRTEKERGEAEKIQILEDGNYLVSSTGFYFSSEETANRVAKAFAHAVKLSGGKSEKF